MNENITFIARPLPLKDSDEKTRVFIPSQNINVFPCSRRGQITTEGSKLNCDPEARLNTERTNRLRTSINGFTDSFIEGFTKNKDENEAELETGTLVFVLAGYRMEVKEFNPASIATALGIDDGTIYAHLSLHDGIPFGVANYFTEILYRQSTKTIKHNYIDVEYSDGDINSDFFMGVSFTTTDEVKDTIVVNDETKQLKKANLPLFSKEVDGDWKLVEASKLPKVEHDTEPDSIKLSGDFTVEHTNDNGDKQTSLKVTKAKVTANEIWLDDIGQVPALELAHFTGTNIYQLRFRFKTTPVTEDNTQPSGILVLKDNNNYILTDSTQLTLVVNAD